MNNTKLSFSKEMNNTKLSFPPEMELRLVDDNGNIINECIKQNYTLQEIKIIIERGAKINKRYCSETDPAPLVMAAYYGRKDIIQYLLENKVEIENFYLSEIKKISINIYNYILDYIGRKEGECFGKTKLGKYCKRLGKYNGYCYLHNHKPEYNIIKV